ncbi:MAG: hypothetical protein GXP10_06240 [Gammaproteobacteria bacterium]|nr:hypothetical protein [Gammaproteobacteria bacterium]
MNTLTVDNMKRTLQRYKFMRKKIGRVAGSNYDLTNKCNLTCEGCLYFSGDGVENYQDVSTCSDWEQFFQREAKRGVNFAYIAGAEPSLVPDRIIAAWQAIGNGVVFTNGIRYIDHDVGFKIHISVWGDVEQGQSYRGIHSPMKAFVNYAGDDRAVVIMTLNAQNISEIRNVAYRCSEYDLPLSFSYFSPTDDYLYRLNSGSVGRSEYFRISSSSNNLLMSQDDFRRARSAIEQVMSEFPETIVYSLAFDSWLSNPDGVYVLDEHGTALNCGNRLTHDFKHFSVMMEEHPGKCCLPNINCKECRAYAVSYASFLTRRGKKLHADTVMEQWVDVWEVWARLFISE